MHAYGRKRLLVVRCHVLFRSFFLTLVYNNDAFCYQETNFLHYTFLLLLQMQTQSSLGDQCIQSEGLAQVKVELKQVAGYNRINIIDVLRHPDESTEDGMYYIVFICHHS